MREIDFYQRIAVILDLCEGDVLYVIDACYSASAAVENPRETLASSAIEMVSNARAVGLQSFTQALCETIRAHPSPATVAQIHARLVSQWLDSKKGGYLQTTPVHKAAAGFNIPSITLAPFQPSAPPTEQKPNRPDPAKAKVLISVTLDGTVPHNLNEWRSWLKRQVPANVAKIEVAGVFEGNSVVVLLCVPVVIWDMLPNHNAYTFVGYVTSPNFIVQELEATLSMQSPLHPSPAIRARDDLPDAKG
jgi:hypothetical protein